MVLLPILLSIAAATVTPSPARSGVALVRATARIVSGASVGAEIVPQPGTPRPAVRSTVDPSNGRGLRLAEFE